MTVEEPEIEPVEDTMDDVNRRLSDAILSLLDDERTLFKVTDFFYIKDKNAIFLSKLLAGTIQTSDRCLKNHPFLLLIDP